MAKKRKKKTSAKRRKAKPARKTTKKRKATRRRRKEGAISRAYHTVTGTISDTGKLRAKMEQRGSDETE
jgi:hypothetical protein